MRKQHQQRQLSDAFDSNKGKLHENLGVPKGEKIGEKRLESAARSGSPTVRKEAQAALNMKRARGK